MTVQAGMPLVASRPATPSLGVVAIIEQVARDLDPHVQGLNFPALAVATAVAESRLNPTAVGDNGTSYGLYQLHEGGELGNLSLPQALNPVTNATTALTTMSAVAAANPQLSPGAIAAAAQRPSDPSAYASEVQYYYNQLVAGVLPGQLQAYGGSGSPYVSAPSGVAVLTAQTSALTGCAAKTGSNPGEPNQVITIPHTSSGLTYCQLKAMLGAVILASGVAIALVGIGIVVYSIGKSSSPLARFARTMTRPVPLMRRPPSSTLPVSAS